MTAPEPVPDAAPDPAEAMLSALVGRWRDAGPAPGPSHPPAHDPFHAIVCAADIAPTGSGPLDGLTLAVKDNITVAGLPTALGSGLPGFTGREDATVVARARRSGARVVAKAQCEAFLLGANSFSSRPEPVRNPHNLRHSAGGSSSGSAALVAAGLADLALGTDSGGSIRIPAAYCGVVGFKPTRGRVPYTGIAPLEPFLEHAGPIAARVDAAAALFRAVLGADGRDPRCAWAAPAGELGSRTGLTGARVAVLDEAMALADPRVASIVSRALAMIEGAGATSTAVSWPTIAETLDIHLAIYLCGQAMVAASAGSPPGFAGAAPPGWADWRSGIAAASLPAPLVRAIGGGHMLLSADPGLYARAVRRADDLAASLDALLAEHDVVALPTTPGVAPPIPDGEPTEDEIYGDTRFTAPFNVTGHPAISLPCGAVGGLPVGLQLVGRLGADEALLELAAAVERILPTRISPIPPAGAPA